MTIKLNTTECEEKKKKKKIPYASSAVLSNQRGARGPQG